MHFSFRRTGVNKQSKQICGKSLLLCVLFLYKLVVAAAAAVEFILWADGDVKKSAVCRYQYAHFREKWCGEIEWGHCI